MKLCRFDGNVCTIVLRKGYYYLENPIILFPLDSNLSIVGYKNEEIIISGGKKIKPNWNPYKTNTIREYTNINIMKPSSLIPQQSTSNVNYLGLFSDYEECFKRCIAPECYGVV